MTFPCPARAWFALVPLLIPAISFAAPSEKEATPAAVEAEFRLLKSALSRTDPKAREKAYRRYAELGEPGLKRLATDIPAVHETALKRAKATARTLGLPLKAFAAGYKAWDDLREKTMTESAKAKDADLKTLDGFYDRARTQYDALQRLIAPVNTALAKLDADLLWLNELEKEWNKADISRQVRTWDAAALLEGVKDAPDLELLSRVRQRAEAAAAADKISLFNGKQKVSPDEAEIVAETNRRRTALGLGALAINLKLTDAARGHSDDMRRLKFFAHESPVAGKRRPGDRAKLAGFSGNGVGENISYNYPGAMAAMVGWWHSAGHRLNLLRDDYGEIGAGTVGPYRTMVLGSGGLTTSAD